MYPPDYETPNETREIINSKIEPYPGDLSKVRIYDHILYVICVVIINFCCPINSIKCYPLERYSKED